MQSIKSANGKENLIHCDGSVTEELWFTGVSMVLTEYWNKLSNSPACDDKKYTSGTAQTARKAAGKPQVSALLPSRFWTEKKKKGKHRTARAVLTVSAEERVCLPEHVCTECWGEAVTSSQKLESEWVPGHSLSRLQSPRKSKKICHTIPFFR